MRKRMKPSRDKRVFSQTADRTKAINLGNFTFRGGIRF